MLLKCVCFASTCFPLAYRFAWRRAEIFELGFRNASRNPCFFKNGNQGPIQRACGGPTPEIWSKKSRFSLGGALYIGFEAAWCFGLIFRFVVHLWSLKKVAEGNFLSKRLKYVSMGECLQIWALYLWHFHVGACTFSKIWIIFANFLSERFVCHVCLHMHFDVFFEGSIRRRMKKMWRKMGTNQHSNLLIWLSKPLYRDWGAFVFVNFSLNFFRKNFGAIPNFFLL